MEKWEMGAIAQPATAMISSLPGGSATGREVKQMGDMYRFVYM